MKRKIYIYLFDGYSDWEIAYLSPELNKSKKHELIYVSNHGNSVTSMGGLQVQPELAMEEVNIEGLDLLILPGGHMWEKEEPKEIAPFLKDVFRSEKPIAAICAATTYLGRLGILDELLHTSNDLNYLKAIASKYKGDKHYQNTLAIEDKNIITANGIAPIEFACEVFKKVALYDEETIEKWFQLFKNGIWSE